MRLTKEVNVYFLLNLLAVVGLCASAITASKIVDFKWFIFPCSNIIFSLLTFPITDIISEVFGKQYAKKTVWISFAAQALFVFLVQSSIYLPAAEIWPQSEAYHSLLSIGPRILLASMVAFLTAQMWDVVVYAFLKRVCGGRFLWIRNCVSTFTSQLINSSLFILIAFLGTQPVLKLIMGSILLKWIIAVVDTPLVYFGVRLIHNYLDGKTLAYTKEQ